jgi:hydroxymethylbilane synthase
MFRRPRSPGRWRTGKLVLPPGDLTWLPACNRVNDLSFAGVPMATIRIATRKSELALWQANYVRARLLVLHRDLAVELVKITTQGDRILDAPLARVGGKGLFIKELEQALLNGEADIAVHSLKDMTVNLPQGLRIAAFCEREDARDAFVSNDYADLRSLPAGARVGTSSLRRQCQLRAAFPALTVSSLRGNVNTRLRRLDAGEFDAIILASAGLRRLGLQQRIRTSIEPEEMLPAVGQGVVCVESRSEDRLNGLLAPLEHGMTRRCAAAERALNEQLGGGCQVPIAAYAQVKGEHMRVRALVGYPDGHEIIRAEAKGPIEQPEALGARVAAELLARGAKAILDYVYERGDHG